MEYYHIDRAMPLHTLIYAQERVFNYLGIVIIACLKLGLNIYIGAQINKII